MKLNLPVRRFFFRQYCEFYQNFNRNFNGNFNKRLVTPNTFSVHFLVQSNDFKLKILIAKIRAISHTCLIVYFLAALICATGTETVDDILTAPRLCLSYKLYLFIISVAPPRFVMRIKHCPKTLPCHCLLNPFASARF